MDWTKFLLTISLAFSIIGGSNAFAQEDGDTEFGEFLYNEASVPTRMEILSLLSKDTPSVLVFLHALSMGLGIDEVLDAAVRYEPDKGRDFSRSAITLLPLIPDTRNYMYSTYELEDFEPVNQSGPYSVKTIAKRFFEDRLVLVPYADWVDGRFHFEASAAELKELSELNKNDKWYRNKSSDQPSDRPVFVSLYESSKTILVDGADRIDRAIEQYGDNATLPVVIVFNRLNELAVDQLRDYPKTIRGVQRAFNENNLMLTPAPEWAKGEHHIYAGMDEIYDIFDIPVETDFEPEHWQRLLSQAEKYDGTKPAFLMVVMGTGEGDVSLRTSWDGQQLAAYDDPRANEAFPYTPANDNVDIEALIAQGLVINRPDMIAALNALGTTEVPVAFYYIDDVRVKPYSRGIRALRAIAIGAGTPPANFGGDGGFGPPDCASPPCDN
ncbi:MAG: hypothetical protein HKN85_03805 [Gammaproteobacteria bacterium]|nr:hypothetical protein [Gammaproteobacteria bacterium]